MTETQTTLDEIDYRRAVRATPQRGEQSDDQPIVQLRLMERFGRFVSHHRRTIACAAVLWVIACGAVGSGVSDRLSTGGQAVPGSESSIANELLVQRSENQPNLLVEISEIGGVGEASADLAALAVNIIDAHPDAQVVSGWDVDGPLDPTLLAGSGEAGLLLARAAGGTVEVQRIAGEIAADLRALPVPGGLSLAVGGEAVVRADLIEISDSDLLRAELLVLPLAVLILLFVFRTPVAAAMPLVVVAVSLTGTLLALRILVEFTEVSVFARSVASVMGLAMSIDMSLFLVAHYREHRPVSSTAREAVARAVGTAGPSILVSGLTTAVSLAGLLVFSPPLLRSFAYAGVAVVLLAVVGGLVVLPAVMMLTGDNLDRWPVGKKRRDAAMFWHRLTRVTMAHKVLVTLGLLTLLAAAASPILRLEIGLNDDRVLPTSVESRAVADSVRESYPLMAPATIPVVLSEPAPPGAAAALAEEIMDIEGVAEVRATESLVTVIPSIEPVSPEGRELVGELRSLQSPAAFWVGGEAGRLVDNTDHVKQRLPWVLVFMVTSSALLVGALTRSVVAPIKAVVLNLASLSVMFGAVVWVFQDGRFEGLLGYTSTGLTDVTVPVLMFCVAFGLSMDYEVYLLARIQTEYRKRRDIEDAVAVGLERTGSVLTASALLMMVTFASFATASVAHLKVLGIGLALAIAVDAFAIRLLLVPAMMALAGRANFWPGDRGHKIVRTSRS